MQLLEAIVRTWVLFDVPASAQWWFDMLQECRARVLALLAEQLPHIHNVQAALSRCIVQCVIILSCCCLFRMKHYLGEETSVERLRKVPLCRTIAQSHCEREQAASVVQSVRLRHLTMLEPVVGAGDIGDEQSSVSATDNGCFCSRLSSYEIVPHRRCA